MAAGFKTTSRAVTGLTEEDEKRGLDDLPESERARSGYLMATHKDEQGRPWYVDLSVFLSPMEYAQGVQDTGAQSLARLAWNIARQPMASTPWEEAAGRGLEMSGVVDDAGLKTSYFNSFQTNDWRDYIRHGVAPSTVVRGMQEGRRTGLAPGFFGQAGPLEPKMTPGQAVTKTLLPLTVGDPLNAARAAKERARIEREFKQGLKQSFQRGKDVDVDKMVEKKLRKQGLK
jgi:hypothetical protein